jgi:hypothetical protein
LNVVLGFEIIAAVNDARVEERRRFCGHRDQLIRSLARRQTSYGHAKEVNVKIIEVRQSKKFKGVWSAFEAPGVEPAFAKPDAARICGSSPDCASFWKRLLARSPGPRRDSHRAQAD